MKIVFYVMPLMTKVMNSLDF